MARRPDPLASLARLLRLQTADARRRLGEGGERSRLADARAEAAAAALVAEREDALPADYAAWLGRGVAERDRAVLGAAHAAERLAQGRAALAEARVAERCIEQLLLDRADAARARLLRKEQALADDATGRKACFGGRG